MAKRLNRRDFFKTASKRPQPAASGYWLHVSRTAMACRFEVTLPAWDRVGVKVARQALDEVDQLEQQLTIFRDTSEVSFINRAAAASAVRVGPSLFKLLLLCKELYRQTEGAFDITSSPLSECWGFLRRQGRWPSPDEIEKARSCVGSDKLILDDRARTIRFERHGVGINLGSIGKGYALDHISGLIKSKSQAALVSAGSSSISAIGSGDTGHNGWKVGVRHPRIKNKRLAVLRLRDVAMATSGSEEQFFEHEGKRYGHIIDARTGAPADKVSGVTVVAGSAAIADALATAFYVGGRELAERFTTAHAGVLVLMLERASEQTLAFGSNNNCEVEIINE